MERNYMNPALSPEERAQLLLADMSTSEKMAQLRGIFPFGEKFYDDDYLRAETADGIGEVSTLEMRRCKTLDEVVAWQRKVQQIVMENSSHHIPAIFHMEGLCGAFIQETTSFPSSIGRGSSFDPALEEKIAAIVSRQEAACGVTHIFAPVLDISRDSRMGRQGETYGEDPALASAMGAAYVRGCQGIKTAGRRPDCVAKHFTGFHNSQGGIHGTASDTPPRLLREIYAKPFQAAISESGLKGIMPCYNAIDGVPVSASHEMLTDLLRTDMGFDGVCVSDYGAVSNIHNVQKLYECDADAGLVSMDAGMDIELPDMTCFNAELAARFDSGAADKSVLDTAVLRVLTAKFRMGLFENPFALTGDELRATLHDADDRAVSLQSAKESLVLLKNDGVLPIKRSVKKIALIGPHADFANKFFGGYTHLCMMESTYAIANSIAGVSGSPNLDGREVPVVPGTHIQSDETEEFAEVLRRQKPECVSVLAELREKLPDCEIVYAYGYPIAGADESRFDEALDAISTADIAILTLGGKHGTCSMASMGEGVDASDINLPACQDAFIRAAAKLGKPLIGVHFNGRPISSDAADEHLSAILEAWNPAETGAEAIVSVLLGEYNPGGKMPVTTARNAGQIPIFYNHINGSSWHQSGSIGFADYVDLPHTPRYCFGHGLSYTSFAYSDLHIRQTEISSDGAVEIEVTVTNGGDMAGDEVVQLYLRDEFASMARPVKELAGFRRIHLLPGQSKRLLFTLPVSFLSFLDRRMQWVTEAGDVTVEVGASSEDIRLTGSFHIADTRVIEGRNRAFYATVKELRNMNHHALARQLAEESIVLLKNEGLLPLQMGQMATFFGRTQLDTIYSGNGSGATMTADRRCILHACETGRIIPEPRLKAWYEEKNLQEQGLPKPGIDWNNAWNLVHSGEMYELFGKYQPPMAEHIPGDGLIALSRAETDTAILTIGRNSGGEECDRYLVDDYLLTDSERLLVEKVCRVFPKVVLVLNVNGQIDLSWTEDYPAIRAILFIGIPGEGGAEALANVLTGRVNPSGKLAFTIARKYEDHPAAKHFSYDKPNHEHILTYADYGLNEPDNGFALNPVTVYAEDVFMGYRGFDAFGVEPLYPFGFGLSYTVFDMEVQSADMTAEGVSICVQVRNTGDRPGKEVVQVYCSPYGGESPRPVQSLAAFAKTKMLAPDESELLTLTIPWRALACYHELSAAWCLEQGAYVLHVGYSSRQHVPAVCIDVPETLLLEQCSNLLTIQHKVDFATAALRPVNVAPDCSFRFTLTEIAPVKHLPNHVEIPDVVRNMSTEELAALLVGYGPGVPFSAFTDGEKPETICDTDGRPLTVNDHPTGMSGYVSPAMPEKEIHSISYQDGPAGVGGVAWPTAMLLACSFDREAWYAFGEAVGSECETRQIDVWLAPAVNLQRHPLCGRNFEYFSEDPLLTGIAACAVTKGAQENHPVRVCPKHFAVNEQETFRRGSSRKNVDAVDSILSERAARELYLAPFEMLVRQTNVRFMMTSFNKINGTLAGGNADLCTRLLRGEWGFDGVVVTDWGDMDTVVDGADAIKAGNDVVMPGGPPVIHQILQGYAEGRICRADFEQTVTNLLRVLPQNRKEQHE